MKHRAIGDEGWLDVLFACTLGATALGGWASTFVGYGWWVAAVAGGIIGAGLAVAVAGRGLGMDALVVLLLVAYLVPAGPLVAGRVAVPSRQTVADAIPGTLDSWAMLLGTHPPVEAEGLLLVPVYLLALVGVGLTVGLALRSSLVGLPLLPVTTLLVAVLLLGRHQPVSLVVQGALFGGLAVLWLLVRGLRGERRATAVDRTPRIRVAAAVALVAVCSVLATLVGEAATGTPERQVLRDSVAAYDVHLLRTPLDDFRIYTVQPPGFLGNVYDDKLLEVSGAPAGTRLRFAALDTYDGVSWKPDNNTDPARDDDRFLRVSGTVDNPARGPRAFVNVEVLKAWSWPWVPTIGQVQTIGFDRPGRAHRLDSLRFNPATGTAVMTDTLEVGDDYEFATVLATDRLTREMEPSEHLDEHLFVISRLLKPASDWWAVGWDTPMDAVYRVAHELRDVGRYSDGATLAEARYRSGHSRKRLGADFVLADPTVGNDEQFAATMALLVNRMAVPARVVVGAVVPEDGVVRGRDVEAWVEVRVADDTWRTLPTEEFMTHRPPERTDPAVVPTRGRGRTFPELSELPPPPERKQPDAKDDSPLDDPRSALWLLVLLGAGVAALPVAKTVRRRRRLRADRVTARYAGAWGELVDRARDLGHPVAGTLTRPGQARLVGAPALADEADRVVFGDELPTAADAAAYWQRVRAQRRALGDASSRWRRLWAPFNPASLRRP